MSTVTIRRREAPPAVAMLDEVAAAPTPSAVGEAGRRLPKAISALVGSGADPLEAGRVVSGTIDAMTRRLIELAIAEMGEPPVPWAWLALGSAARREQGIGTDQDHALAYDPQGWPTEELDGYFLRLAESVTSGLEAAGIPRCRADVVAVNQALRRPLEHWVEAFEAWMADPRIEAVRQTTILFDHRRVAGALDVERTLRQTITSSPERPAFVGRLRKMAMEARPRRRLRLPRRIDVKHDGLMQIVGLARILAVEGDIPETGTIERLQRAAEQGLLDEGSADRLAVAFRVLWRARLGHQIAAAAAGEAPGDFVGVRTPELRTELGRAIGSIHAAQEDPVAGTHAACDDSPTYSNPEPGARRVGRNGGPLQRAVTWRAAAMAAILSVVAWGCTGGEPTSTREGSASAATEPAGLEGGTLRVGLSDLVAARISYPTYLDPQAPFLVADVDREILRCCLTRTLLSYTGRSTADGGTVLHPDLATGLPEISDDGLTWTFHLKEGIRYAPPLADVEITSPHIVRALERTATPAIGTEDNVVVFEPIEGVREFADGEASTISGLETPDPYTLRVHLSEVTNDLGYRFALPATAPIPPSPADPSARFGAAEGHDDGYGSFLVSSGPYMIEGSEDLDPSLPPEEQRQVSGLVTGESLTLVRNPSWSRETDELRKAYVDRIELRVVPWRQGWRAVEEGTLDLLYWGAPPPEQLERFEQDPDLRDRVFRGTCDGVGYVAIRLAAPPFDDVHVRRAAAYAFDEEEAARVASAFRWGGAGFFQFVPHAHIAPDPTLAGLLAGWDPYPYDLARAREEMSRSRYDVDHDGVCDHPSCRNVLALESNFGPEPKLDEVWAQGLEAIGITLDIRYLGWGRLYREMSDPESEAVLSLGPFWSAEYPSPAPLFVSGYGSTGIGSQAVPNFALLGATPDQLAGWGYEATSVPSVDTKITACLGLIGPAQQQCWAELDQLLMRQIVPAIPFVANNEIRIVSERVDAFSFDQAFSGLPALDQISLEPEDT